MRLAVTKIHHMNTCLSPEPLSRKFQVEWARAEARTKPKASAVMGQVYHRLSGVPVQLRSVNITDTKGASRA